jgi:hypothetical protein
MQSSAIFAVFEAGQGRVNCHVITCNLMAGASPAPALSVVKTHNTPPVLAPKNAQAEGKPHKTSCMPTPSPGNTPIAAASLLIHALPLSRHMQPPLRSYARSRQAPACASAPARPRSDDPAGTPETGVRCTPAALRALPSHLPTSSQGRQMGGCSCTAHGSACDARMRRRLSPRRASSCGGPRCLQPQG